MTQRPITNFFIGMDSSIHAAVACIDRNAQGIALVVDETGRLLGTITDGDVRRAMLEGIGFDAPVRHLLEKKVNSFYPKPVTAQAGASYQDILALMEKYVIRQVPILDSAGKVVDLITVEDILPREGMPLKAVVMAGGYGVRLRPLTDEIPKPMLPIGDRPLMERIIAQLRQAGIRNVSITTHFMADKIKEYFGDGRDFGVDIDYVDETRPLGTAGALGLLESPSEPLLVIWSSTGISSPGWIFGPCWIFIANTRPT